MYQSSYNFLDDTLAKFRGATIASRFSERDENEETEDKTDALIRFMRDENLNLSDILRIAASLLGRG